MNQTPELLHLEITDEKTLSEATDLLHDAGFNPDEIYYDVSAGTFTMLLDRERSGIGRNFMGCRLTFLYVTQYSQDDEEIIGSFNEIHYNAATSIIELVGIKPFARINVSKLSGELEDTGELTPE